MINSSQNSIIEKIKFTAGDQEAIAALQFVIGVEASRFRVLEGSSKLTEDDKNRYRALVNVSKEGAFTMNWTSLLTSLKTLSQLLSKHYGKKVILLIDEYWTRDARKHCSRLKNAGIRLALRERI